VIVIMVCNSMGNKKARWVTALLVFERGADEQA
jgi:hypothetical protein